MQQPASAYRHATGPKHTTSVQHFLRDTAANTHQIILMRESQRAGWSHHNRKAARRVLRSRRRPLSVPPFSDASHQGMYTCKTGHIRSQTYAQAFVLHGQHTPPHWYFFQHTTTCDDSMQDDTVAAACMRCTCSLQAGACVGSTHSARSTAH